MDEIDRKMAKMDCKLNKVKMEVDNQLVTNKNDIGNISIKVTEIIQGQKGQWCDVVKRHVDVTLEKVTDNIQEVCNSLSDTRAQAAEQRDKESRRNNLILYKVPESTQPRVEDRNEADIDFCIQLFNNALLGVSNEDFIHVTDNIQEVCNSLSDTRAQAAEQRDKESRRNNMILYKVPESTQPRVEDRNEADIDYCLQLFNNALLGVSNEDFIHVFLLGKRGDDTAPTRPLLIQLASYTFKNLILESLSKLKHAEQKYKNVIIAHNMTKTEREEC